MLVKAIKSLQLLVLIMMRFKLVYIRLSGVLIVATTDVNKGEMTVGKMNFETVN